MDLDRPELVATADSVERADQIARLDRTAGLGGEDEPIIRPCPGQLGAIGGLRLAPEVKHSLCNPGELHERLTSQALMHHGRPGRARFHSCSASGQLISLLAR